jgi:hypothetical protein
MAKKPEIALSLAPLARAVSDGGIAWANQASQLPAVQNTEIAPTEPKVTLEEIQAYVAARHTDVSGQPIKDWHPVKVLASLSIDPNVKPEVRARAASDAASYLFQRLRALEIESNHHETHTFVVRKEFSFIGGDGAEIRSEDRQ